MNLRMLSDRLFKQIVRVAAYSSVAILLGIFGMLLYNGLRAFGEIALFNSHWNPAAYGEAEYGIGSMIVSTLMVSVGAMAIAIPLGIGTAAYLSELAPKWVKETVKPAIEILASIPSVTIGFLGIVLLGPLLSDVFNLNNSLNALNGAILLAVMSLPTIITVSEDVIHSVDNSYKEASYALGANKWETIIKVTLPSATSGLIAAVMLGLGRAVGETMTVLMATGNANQMPGSFFDPIRTMTATIAIELGEVPFGTKHYFSLFAIGAVLFLFTLAVNLVAESISARYRKAGK